MAVVDGEHQEEEEVAECLRVDVGEVSAGVVEGLEVVVIEAVVGAGVAALVSGVEVEVEEVGGGGVVSVDPFKLCNQPDAAFFLSFLVLNLTVILILLPLYCVKISGHLFFHDNTTAINSDLWDYRCGQESTRTYLTEISGDST